MKKYDIISLTFTGSSCFCSIMQFRQFHERLDDCSSCLLIVVYPFVVLITVSCLMVIICLCSSFTLKKLRLLLFPFTQFLFIPHKNGYLAFQKINTLCKPLMITLIVCLFRLIFSLYLLSLLSR